MVKVSKKELTELVNQGKKKEELAEYYKIPTSEIVKLVKEAGLKFRKTRKRKSELVDDTTATTTQETVNQ